MKLGDFIDQTQLSKMTMLYLAQNLDEKTYKKVRRIFMKIDKDQNGTVSMEEFQKYI